jgi:Xaa-Pro aminopeptidase
LAGVAVAAIGAPILTGAQTPRTPGRVAVPTKAEPAPIANAEFAARRQALAAALADGVILAMGGREPALDYLGFHQASQFLYLTGVHEPDAALVGMKRGGTVTWTLFVQPREPSREVWTGRRTGPERAAERWGLPGRPFNELAGALDTLLAEVPVLSVIGDLGVPGRATEDGQFVAQLKAKHPQLEVRNASPSVSRLRAFKSDAELALIRRAAAITVEAHAAARDHVRADAWEYEADGAVTYTFRRNGAERAAFANIVGSGPNSTTLHYTANQRQMRAGEMVVVDIGANYRGYSADMTRSYPVSGRFTPEQRAVYQVVRDAQAAAERQAVAGNRARLMSDSATATLAAGLARLGLIDSANATFDCGPDGSRQCRQVTLFYMHGLGHGIGLEVHDPDRYYFDDGLLAPGSVFTIEPGVYVRENLLETIPETPRNRAYAERLRPLLARYANIGVRIEDDYLVTATGLEWLTKSPREVGEIEAAMRRRPTP